ncbi:hypothetical protein EVAR_21455_1 [Eumeta japonica]|uniref:Uncharacterized protein n=1 Tax=Eumeta variegata TaxID=151549 RepID=A0A4C1VH71_EUMVA|nr:hypothetical protein EVAR_21455_1 [Eumeta japonica]
MRVTYASGQFKLISIPRRHGDPDCHTSSCVTKHVTECLPVRAGHIQGLTDHKSSNAMSSHRPKRNRNPPACHRTAQSPYQLNWVWNTTYG